MRQNRRLFSLTIFLLLSVLSLSAQQSVLDFYAPDLLSAGAANVGMISPQGDLLNPANSGLKQQITLDLSYLSLAGVGSSPGWGNIVNLGASFPTALGVFSGSGHFFSSPFARIYPATYGELDFSFAKDVFPTLLLGAGAGFQLGTGGFGLGLDLGFIHLPGDFAIFKDFHWGVALRDAGLGYSSGNATIPPVFTPAVGTGFTLVKTSDVAVLLGADLSFPSFQDVAASVGTEIELFDFLAVQASYNFDLGRVLDGSAPAIPLGLGLAFKFKGGIDRDIEFMDISKKGLNRGAAKATLAATPLVDGVMGLGLGVNLTLGTEDKSPPQITLEQPKNSYVSPNNDGTQDDILIPITITDQRYVMGYELTIYNEAGEPVRTLVNKDERPENYSFKNIVEQLKAVKKGIPIPEYIRWDGKSDGGTVVADGTYTYQLKAWDDNGNQGVSGSGTLVIDSTPPEVQTSASYLIFSPNHDGSRDTLNITQSGSHEEQWQASILDAEGNTVVEFNWKDQDLTNLVWDGTNQAGALVPDGVYSYVIKSTDKAGNTTVNKVENIIVNTEATPILVSVAAVGFSPNGDGIKDTIAFTPYINEPKGIVSWKLDMTAGDGSVQKSFSGSSPVPASLTWDGQGESGPAPEGLYRGLLTVEYENGNMPEAKTAQFLLDVTPPRVILNITPEFFSPDNDGVDDELTLTLKVEDASDIENWNIALLDPTGQLFTDFKGKGMPAETIIWDGLSQEGELVQAATDYKLELTITDTLGNTSRESSTVPVDVLVIREGDKLKIRISSITFAANKADYVDVGEEKYERNMKTLRRLAEILKKYSRYHIRIEGYAVMIHWDDPVKGKKEQEEELIPLSKARAEAIKQALVNLGIDANRITTVGLGGANPVVPFSDKLNRWKNRRVEFILLKN